jgi:hypothetical protein
MSDAERLYRIKQLDEQLRVARDEEAAELYTERAILILTTNTGETG